MLYNFVSFIYPTCELPTITHSNIFIKKILFTIKKKFQNIGRGEMLNNPPNEFYFVHLLANKAQHYTKLSGFFT
jgi:hypothetical protein